MKSWSLSKTRIKNKASLVKQYLLHVFSYKFNYPLVYPTDINFQMTDLCNLRCKMCTIPRDKPREKYIEKRYMKKVLDELADGSRRYVSFVGGESLLRTEDTLDMIGYAHKKGFQTAIVTNGTLLTERLCKQVLDAGIDRISISIDGPKKVHDFIRREGTFDQVVDAVKAVKSLSKEVKLDFNTTIMSYNYRHLTEIHTLALKLGIDEVFYQALIPDNTHSTHNYNSELWIQPPEIPSLKKEITKLIVLKKKYNKINNSVEYLRNVPKYFIEKDKFHPGKCLAGYLNLNVDPYGYVSICGFGPLMNIREHSFRELWKSEGYRKTRKKIKGCKKPCLMLCYRKAGLKEMVEKLASS